MDQHTKEPWLVYVDPEGRDLCAYIDYIPAGWPLKREVAHAFGESREANARRIVACVNALAGWDTATLERYAAGGVPGNPNLGQKFHELKIAQKQRDELQAHLANANAALAVAAEERDQLLTALGQCLELSNDAGANLFFLAERGYTAKAVIDAKYACIHLRLLNDCACAAIAAVKGPAA